ncbi:unnamed protein product [Phytophthora fragariaefolia]|uniref:Unnamed protein product n=1 Tax=Phytophthora fragariaefolia TaxID=1490495 RepID=A0A9W6TQY6_9STRA|nr:unnamed protein product [Phytophthora fragariaefolia]
MPLFDAIESDVTAFFVSQGTVFDSLLKSVLDRVALVESSVAMLRMDVSNNFNLVNNRIDASNVAAAEVSAATAAAAAAAAASAALASLPPVVECATYSLPPPEAAVVESGGRNEELEYYVMTLSRQLNMVLEVLFQPHADNVVEAVQTKQSRLHSISDVLTENEAILMELAIQHHDPIQQVPSQKLETGDGTQTKSIAVIDQPSQGQSQLSSVLAQEQTLTTTPAQPSENSQFSSRSQEFDMAPPPEQPAPSNLEASATSNQVTAETIRPQLEASPLTKKETVVRAVNNDASNQASGSTPEEHEENSDEATDYVPMEAPFSLQKTHVDISLHRTKSFFRNCQDLQRQEEARLREQQRREEELMRRMHELLLQSRSHLQQEHLAEWQRQQNEATQHHQQLIFHLQGQLQSCAQEQLQSQLQSYVQEQLQNQLQDQLLNQQQQEQVQQLHKQGWQEWRREYEQCRESDMITVQHEIERKLEAFNGIITAAQATHGHELAQAMQLIGDFERRFVSLNALEGVRESWLKMAADNCIYGANPETLSSLLQDLQGFQNELKQQVVKAPAITALHEAVDRAIQLLQQPVSPNNDNKVNSEQENAMYTLRQLLAKVDTSHRAAVAEHTDLEFPAVGFLAGIMHQMELGTANLLDAVDFQQGHFQQIQVQHQARLDKLQKELWRQQEAEKVLKTQLGACPSKEDTLRLVQELRDQVRCTLHQSVDYCWKSSKN